MIEDIRTFTATAKELVRMLAVALRLNIIACMSVGVCRCDSQLEEEWMACSRRCGPPFAAALKPAA